jgi:hypothetical protein
MPDQFEQYYKYLKANGADVAPNFNLFKNSLSDYNNASKYYSYLKENEFDVPATYDSFADTFGLKKKDIGGPISSPTGFQSVSKSFISSLPEQKSIYAPSQKLASESTTVVAPKEAKLISEANKRGEQITKEAIANSNDLYLKSQNKGGYKFTKEDPSILNNKKELEQDLKDGTLQVVKSPKTGKYVLAYKADMLKSFSQAWDGVLEKQANDKYVAGLSTEDKIKHYEAQDILNQDKYLEAAPSGFSGSVGRLLGENAEPLIKLAAMANIGGKAAQAAGATAQTVANAQKFGSFLAFATDAGYSGYANNTERVYKSLRKQDPNGDPVEQMRKAENAGLIGEASGIGMAAGMTGIFKNLKGAAETINTKPFVSALETMAKHTSKEAAVQGSIASLNSIVSDLGAKSQGLDIGVGDIVENTLESGKQMAQFVGVSTLAMGALTGLMKVPGYVKAQAKGLVSELPREEVKAVYEGAEANGIIPKGTTDKVINSLNQYDKAKEKLPEGLTEDKKASLTGIQEKIDKLEESKKKLALQYHDRVDNTINSLKDRALKILESKDPLAEEVDNTLGVKGSEEIAGEPAFPAEVEATEEVKDLSKFSEAELEKRQLEIEGSKSGTPENKEFNDIDKELEKREWRKVFDSPLDKVAEVADELIKKNQEQPNGFGSYIQSWDARSLKLIADKYSKENVKKLTDSEIIKDYKDAMFGNPTSWYSDGLRLRESVKEAQNRGIGVFKELSKEFIKDGYSEQDAMDMAKRKLEPILKDLKQSSEKPLGLEQKPTEVKVTEDIEAKKADIEKRRKEELDSLIQAKPIEVVDEKGNVVQTSDKRAAINAKYDAEISALESGKAELKPEEQKVTVELLSSKEPPQKEGETIVTLSGKTEAERLASIERRISSTKVTDYVLAKNKIVQDATLYFKRVKENGRYKNTPQGRAELNDLRLRARELGLTVDTERDKVTMPSKKTGRPTKVSYDNRADSDAVVESNGKTLTERNRDVQEAFEELTDAGVFLDIKSESGNRMSASQIDSAISDILEGIPSKAANKYLDALEKGLAEDAIPLYDKGMGGFAPKLADIRAQLGVEKEFIGEPMDEVALNKFLDEESRLTPEEEQTLLDNVENLLYEYETTEEGPQGKVQPIEARAEEGIPAKTEPVTEAKAAGEAPKPVKEVYDEFSSKKSELAKKKIINDNFDTIVEDLIKNKKIERIC